jgi:hypothetical protein
MRMRKVDECQRLQFIEPVFLSTKTPPVSAKLTGCLIGDSQKLSAIPFQSRNALKIVFVCGFVFVAAQRLLLARLA